MNGGELDQLKEILKDSFLNIKHDMGELHAQITDLKKKIYALEEENRMLKSNIKAPQNNFETKYIKRIKQNKKMLLKNRILELANLKSLTISEIKDVVVDQEDICSRATFYRYIQKLQRQKLIDSAIINENNIIIRI